jgi:Type ISP C-terminal specificity domain
VQFKRTWPIAPDTHTLGRRWQKLTNAPDAKKADLFVVRPARNLDRAYSRVLGMDPENMPPTLPVLRNARPQDQPATVRYGYRTLDRQFAFADSRLADRPRADLWRVHSDKQVYMTSLLTGVLGLGPAASVTAYVPDLHHFRRSFGGKDVIPLWRDAAGTEANINPALVQKLSDLFGQGVTGEDVFSYCYAVLSSPSYVDQFSEELVLPGPRIPITKDEHLFMQAVKIGWQLISLQTFGERSAEPGTRVNVPQGEARCVKAVPGNPASYPDEVFYDRQGRVLHVGTGEFAPVAPGVWDFSVSGFEPVQSWVAYRLADGAGRRSSSLDGIRPERWTAEMTEELLRVLWIVERTLEVQPKLIAMLDEIVNGETVGHEEVSQPASILREPVPEVKHVIHVQGTFDE